MSLNSGNVGAGLDPVLDQVRSTSGYLILSQDQRRQKWNEEHGQRNGPEITTVG